MVLWGKQTLPGVLRHDDFNGKAPAVMFRQRSRIFVVLAALLPALPMGVARAQTPPAPAAFAPDANTFTAANAPATLCGEASTVQVQAGTASHVAYFKFNLMGLTGQNTPVACATLRLYGNHSGANYFGDDAAYGVPDTNWTETTLTPQNAPALGDPQGVCLVLSAPHALEWDVTAWIARQVAAGKTEAALAVQMQAAPADGKPDVFNSREAQSDTPQLIVTLAAPPALRVNFQPASSPVPPGWDADTGAAFDPAAGRGWVRQDSLAAAHVPLDLSPDTRDRKQSGVDALLNTIIHVQYPTNAQSYPDANAVRVPGAWDVDVPNGTYSVTISAGDMKSVKHGWDGRHTINVNGATAISQYVGTDAAPFAQATVPVVVNNGRLTLDAQGGVNTKANYVVVQPLAVASPAGFTKLAWSTAAPAPVRRTEAQRGVVNGKAYVFGGLLDSTSTPSVRSDMYDAATNTWSPLPDLPEPFTHAGVAVRGVHIYLAGGYRGPGGGRNQIFGSAHVWDFNTQTLTYARLPDLPAARGAGALAILNGVLHYFGGANINRVDCTTHWTLDLNRRPLHWQNAAPLHDARNHVGGIALGGRIYCVGGEHGQDAEEVPVGTVEVWEPTHPDGWQFVRGLPRARSHIAGALFTLGSRLLIVGGETFYDSKVTDVTAYDPFSNTWNALTPLPHPCASNVGFTIGGKIYYSTSYKMTTYVGTPAD